VSRAPDAWTALRGSPWRFLASAWPWRSVAYLVTSVPLGVLVVVVLGTGLLLGVVTLVVVVGLAVLAGLPVLIGVLGVVERRRLALVQPPPAAGTVSPTLTPAAMTPAAMTPAAMSARERFRLGRRLPMSWSEAGYAVLLGGVLWWVDFAVLVVVGAVPPVLLVAPLLVRTGEHLEVLGWRVDSDAEAWVAVAAGVPALALAAYVFTALAAGQAGLARLLLDPREAELAAAVADLRRSRVQLVDAFETERRRIERDLHDGVQQRLVALTMTLGRAELDVAEGPGLDLVRRAHAEAEAALEELRGTVRGIHPRVLVDHGLAAAVHEVADRCSVPVSVDIGLTGRLPAPVEAAAYFVASEALTNVDRHARARRAEVHAWLRDGSLVLSVVDDGVGGARPVAGSGLAGLAVRLEALGGRLRVTSPAGGPTEIRMECPCDG
jgi:signal transduction histidine kinase